MNPVGNLSDALAFSVIACVLGLSAASSSARGGWTESAAAADAVQIGGGCCCCGGGGGGGGGSELTRIALLPRKAQLNNLSPMIDLNKRLPPTEPVNEPVPVFQVAAVRSGDTVIQREEKEKAADTTHVEKMEGVEAEEPLLNRSTNSDSASGCSGSGSGSGRGPQSDGAAYSEAEAVEAAAASEEEEEGRRRLRVFGVVRSVGSLGFLLTSSCFALLMRTLFAGAPPTDTIGVSLVGADAVWLVSAAAFLFYRPGRIAPNQNLLASIAQFVRIPDIVLLFAFVFVEGIFFGILETYLFLYACQLKSIQILYLYSSTIYSAIGVFTRA